MYTTLYKYLALYKTLNIPGVGNFSLESTPATLQFTDKKLQPPGTQIKFAQVVHPTNNHFYSFLSKEWKVEKVIAIRMFKEGVEEIMDTLKQSGSFQLDGMGTVRKINDSEIGFTPAEKDLSFFAPLPAERVLRRHAQHTVLVGEREHIKAHTISSEETDTATEEKRKEKWWIYVLVLALVAALLIGYYYLVYKTN